MPRLTRHAAFDITDEPDNCYDATGQFPRLTSTPPVDEDPASHGPRRKRTVAYLALTLAATSAGAVALTPRPAPKHGEASKAQKPAPTPPRSQPVADPPEPTAPVKPRTTRSKPKRSPHHAVRVAAAPVARVEPVHPAAPTASEPTGGEFILGAR